MFPSSGLFSYLNCPFSKRGRCERPQCWYKHGTALRDAAAGSPAIGRAGVQNGFPNAGCGAPVNDATRVVCFQQLERINKEIETVRNEVERQQRRLSCYQTVQAESKNTGPNTAEDVETGSHSPGTCTNFTKTFSQASKYVIDNSKPRTDLEYDPLSNFSADLRSYSSVGKDQKAKNEQGLKRARKTAPCDQTKPESYQPQLSQSPSPDPFDDSNEDDILIIDIPPSTDRKRGPVQKSFQDKVEELKVKKAPIFLDLPLVLTREENTIDKKCCTKNSQGPSDCYETKESQNVSFDGSVIDLTKYSGDPGRKRQKTLVERSPEAASPLCPTDEQDKNLNGLVGDQKETTVHVESPQRELLYRGDEMNPHDPYYFPSKNSLFYKPPEANSDSLYRQHIKQVLTSEQPALLSSTKSVPSVLPCSQKTAQKMPGLMLGNATDDCASSSTLNLASGSRHGQAEHNLSPSKLAKRAEPSSASTSEKHMEKTENEAAIVIDSSSDDEDELNYSEMEMSDSDPMEECYRIFMEANNEEKSDASVGATDEKKTESNVQPQVVTGNKRVAHEAKDTEQPGAKSRPEPKVLVPLRGPAVSGFASHPSIPSKIQQVQQRASMLTASVQSGQAFVSSTCQRRPETQGASAQTTEKRQPAAVTNAYLNYIAFGPAVFEVGNNLQVILPQGAFPLPVASACSQVSAALTPISQVRPRAVADKQTHHPVAVTLQKYHTMAPVLIPAQARKPSMASALTHSSPAVSAAPQAAGNTTVKPGSTKRKLKQVSEEAKDKVPHDVRQRYVNMFTEEFLKTTANVNDAFEKALAEERAVYNRSVNKLKYLSVAVNALKRLKSQSAVAVKDKNVVSSQTLKGNIPFNMNTIKGNADDLALYESLTDYILTEEKLIEGNYPAKHPEKWGSAVLFEENKKGPADPLKRICCRCGATYSVGKTGEHIRKEECNYHYGKVVRSRVPGGMETRYSCCEGVMGAPGCQVYKLHVHNSLGMDGFVSTLYGCSPDTRCPGVYAIDCEMCYTKNGLELSRVTLVNSSLQVIYDTFVRPDHEVIDYNTRFSGISEEEVRGNRTSLKEVQKTLLSFISADTILIGHGLETDLCALKLLHGKVVDTSVVFPHRLGPPNKRTLNNLTAEYLMRIIQESVCGRDTAEDASACMELILWKVKEDGKLKK